MDYRKFENKFIVRLEKGEEIINSLKEICKNEKIELAEVTGIGASDKVEIGVFNVNTKEYKTKIFDGMFEITSLVGSVCTKEDEPYLHLHINFGDEDGLVKGGHLVSSRISATCEIIISEIDGKVERKFNNEIGLNLFNF